MSRAPPLLSSNRFSILEIIEPKIVEDAQKPDTPTLPPTKPCKPRRPKWEKRIKRKLVIHSLELDAKCIMLPIHLKMTDTMEETSTEAMVDTGDESLTSLAVYFRNWHMFREYMNNITC